MNQQRSKFFQRNPDLERLIRQLNGILRIAESQIIDSFVEPKLPIILVLGCARSGTTLFMQWLANLGHFSYPTNFLSRFYESPYIGGLIQEMLFNPRYEFREELHQNNVHIDYSSELGKTRGPLAPHEFWYFWRRFFNFGEIQKLNSDELNNADTTSFLMELGGLESVFEKPIAMKAMIMNWHIPYIGELFKRVLFVFIRREPLFNAQSILNSRDKFYGSWSHWYSFKPPEFFELQTLDPIEQVAGQVYFTNHAISVGLKQIPPVRYLEINYEDFCDNPESTYRLIESKLSGQGHELNHEYTGPSKFKSTNENQLESTDLVKLSQAYIMFERGK